MAGKIHPIHPILMVEKCMSAPLGKSHETDAGDLSIAQSPAQGDRQVREEERHQQLASVRSAC
jgi:hypothetical protein